MANPWMQKLQQGLLGTPDGYGILADPQMQQAQNAGMMDFGSAMLAASGPSRMPTSLGQAFGQASIAGRGGQQNAIQNSLNAALLKKTLTQKDKKDLVAVMKDGKPQYVNAENAEGQTPYSLATPGQGSADIQGLNNENSARQAAGMPPLTMLEFITARTAAMTQSAGTVTDFAGGRALVDTKGKTKGQVTPLTSATQEAAGKSQVAGAESTATTTAKTEAERTSNYINEGLHAADSLPVINRALQLLDSVKTGGIDAAKLAATNLLGVTGADEAELSNNIGKAVLSQLRSTFGAQFTEREGERLANLEAGFGKSTEGNKRILGQVKQIVDRSARRGIEAAKKTGDTFTVDEISKSMNMDLAPPAEKTNWEEGGYMFRRLPDGTVQRKKK